MRFFVASVLVAGVFLLQSSFASAAITAGDMGANITPVSSTDFDSGAFKQALQKLKADHANSVSLVIPIFQSNIYASDIYGTGQTPNDAAIGRAIQYAHSLGLTVTLKPHLDPQDGQWRANINPSNRSAWFTNYGALIKRYAGVAQTYGAERFIVGTEMIALASDDAHSANTSGWRTIIADVRSVYSGKVSYAANWGPTGSNLDEKNRIAFWDAVDEVGLDAYYPLNNTYGDNSVASFQAAWEGINNTDIAQFQVRVGKPLFFSEIGYKSTGGAHISPGDYWINNGVNQEEQANAYEALFSFWDTKPFLTGIYLWEWSSYPSVDSNDTNYTPQNKSAEAVVVRWFGGNGVSSPYNNAAHALTATAQPVESSSPTSPITLSATVVNSGRPEQNLIVDIEVYNAAGSRVFQKFFQNEQFAVGQSKNFAASWTPGTAGTFAIRVGVFGAGWAPTHVWNHNAAVATIGSGTTAPPSVPAAFSTSATAPAQVATNQALNFTASATATGGASQALVDVEIYDSSNQKKFQQFFSSQSFAAGETKNFSLSWTPSVAGTYRITTGVFSNDWSQNYVWNNQAATFTVGTSQSPPVEPPPPSTPPNPPSPPATTTPPVAPPVQPTVSQSQIRNGNVMFVSLQAPTQPFTQGQAGTITASLKSQGGENANNVSVHVELIQNGVIVAKSVSSTDILHDSTKSFTLNTPNSLQAGTYSIQVEVFNNADRLLNKQFLNIGTLTIASSQ